MAHSLIFGMTESGKTTLAKQMCRGYFAQGYGVLVLDPMCDPGWKPESPDGMDLEHKYQLKKRFYQTDDPDEFLRVFWDSRACMVFIDEAGDVVGQYDLAMRQTATKGRHWGHCVHYLSQRGAQLSPTVRGQCEHMFLFTTARQDCELFAREWNKPELVEAAQLPRLEFFHVQRYAPLQRGKVSIPGAKK